MSRKANPTISAILFKRLQGLSAPGWLIDMAQNRVIWTNTADLKPVDSGGATNDLGSGLDQGSARHRNTTRGGPHRTEQSSICNLTIDPDGRLNADMPAMRQLKLRHQAHLQSGPQPSAMSGSSTQTKDIHQEPQSVPLGLRMPSGELHQHCTIEFMPRPSEKLVLIRAQAQRRSNRRQNKLHNLSAKKQSPRSSLPQTSFGQSLSAPSIAAQAPRTHPPRTSSPLARLVAAEQFPRRGRLYADLQQGSKAHANNNTPASYNTPDSARPANRPSATACTAAPPSPSAAISADAKTLQEIAKRIRETPAGLVASPFSLEALHAAASDNGTTPEAQTASALRRAPTIISFRRAARARTKKLNALAAAAHRPAFKSAFASVANVLPATAQNLSSQMPEARPLTPSPTVPELARPAAMSAEPVAANIADVSRTGVTKTDAAKLAHELRTPLSAIQSAAEILADEQFGPIGNARYKDYAQDIKQSAVHTLSVIEAMLDPDYLATGTPLTDRVSIDLRAHVETNISAFAPLAAARAITITTEFAETLPPLYADRRAVNQILLNLLTNALKFTPKDGVITVAARVDPDGSIRLSICDSGPGMSRDHIRAVLHGGVIQARDGRGTTSGESGINDADQSGLGFGLPIVLSLAKANGAGVALTSSALGGLCASVIFTASNQRGA